MILLVGKSGSGKDFLVGLFSLRPVISRTTRPKRDYEIDGVHKIFITDRELDSYKKEDIVAYTVYDRHRYCALREDLNEKDVYVIDPPGVRSMGAIVEHIVIYVRAPLHRRLKRLYQRELESITKKQVKENTKISYNKNRYRAFLYGIRRVWHDYLNYSDFEKNREYNFLLRN